MKCIFLLAFLLFFKEISGDCDESFVYFCDHLNDYLNNRTHDWRQLLIGHEDYPGDSTFTDLKLFFEDLPKLEWLTIINEMNVEFNQSIRLNLEHNRLRYINFYKNNIDTFHLFMFTNMPKLIELKLTNNNIVYIHGNRTGKIDTIDLSDNKIQEIGRNTFINLQMRRFIMKRNRLSLISKNSFNDSLEILNLDNNNLNYISNEVFQNLINLKEITLSHNKLSTLWDVTPHEYLEILDVSHNNIVYIDSDFSNFKYLKRMDFSYNKILQDLDLVSIIPNNLWEKKISLAYNHLTGFYMAPSRPKLNYTSPVTFILFGNPWICECLDELEIFFKENNFKRGECDTKLSFNGKLPVCVKQNACIFLGSRPQSGYFVNYFKVLKEASSDITCDISRDMLDFDHTYRQKIISIEE